VPRPELQLTPVLVLPISDSVTSFLQTAIDIVTRAGEMQMAQLGAAFRISKKAEIDLVTEVDLAVERMCQDMIRERYPSHRLVGEELGGGETASAAGHCWVFDPIDGTTNYAHGLPIFCSSLALQVDGFVEVGAIFDPTRRELFTAERGGGAFLNGTRLHVSFAAPLVDALLVTGFPYDVHRTIEDALETFGAFLRRARAVRRLGSAALDLCYVAAGRMDGFWEEKLKAWDTAAGALMVEEAAGRVTNFEGGPFVGDRGEIVASNGLIHDEMLDVLRAR
jgi:myo-inositol-1(or 4)-monophosphatase